MNIYVILYIISICVVVLVCHQTKWDLYYYKSCKLNKKKLA